MKKIFFPVFACLVLLLSVLYGYHMRNTDLNISTKTSVAVQKENRKDHTEEYRYHTEELYASKDNQQIYGIIYIPDKEEKMPAVIFSHGFGGNYEVGAQYAEAFAQKGYVVYCFDFCGGSPGSRSDGSTLDMSIFTEQRELFFCIRHSAWWI